MDTARALRSGGKSTDTTTAGMTGKDGKDNVAQELKKLTQKIDEMNGNIRKELNSKVDHLESAMQKNHGGVMAELAKQSKEIRTHMDLEIARLEARMDTMEGKIAAGPGPAAVSKPRFDPRTRTSVVV